MDEQSLDRRRLLVSGTVAIAVGLAGCSDERESATKATPSETTSRGSTVVIETTVPPTTVETRLPYGGNGYGSGEYGGSTEP
jgi:type IV pilus biogenesis protein CpaD/CtpE